MNNIRPRWPDMQIDDEEPESTGIKDHGKNESTNKLIKKNKDQVVSIDSYHSLFVNRFILIYLFSFHCRK
jgi:hypothetical protein